MMSYCTLGGSGQPITCAGSSPTSASSNGFVQVPVSGFHICFGLGSLTRESGLRPCDFALIGRPFCVAIMLSYH